jgi:pilus assembly protein Flp/PilA
MRKQLTALVKDFARDERGASLLEYTLLLGIITVVAVSTITSVGAWVADQWGLLVQKGFTKAIP